MDPPLTAQQQQYRPDFDQFLMRAVSRLNLAGEHCDSDKKYLPRNPEPGRVTCDSCRS